ncbi:MAG TPA: TolC family protein [Candidatus Sulfopaludibacter sp.]|nr:TolC family protein [Candidatus Sulfopaludibacter sp.]
MKYIFPIFLCVQLGGGVIKAGPTNAMQTLTLPEAQQLALQNHPQIAAANYRALAAQEAVVESRAGFFPSVNLYGTAVGVNEEGTRIMAGGLNNPSVYDRAAGGLQVSQLLTDFGRTANLTASSKFQARAESQNLALTREQVLLGVDTAYFGTLAAQAVLRVARQTFDTRQLLLDQVTALATNKLRSELDVSFAQVELQQARLLVEKSQNNADAAMAVLSTALGYQEFHQFQLVEQAPPAKAVTNDISDLVQTALSRRPELLSLRDERDAALRFAKAERDSRLPAVAALGVAGDAPTHDSHLPDDYAAGGVQLSLPLFAGGFYVARQHEAELKAQSEGELLRSAEDNVIRDVRVAWLNFNNALEQLHTTGELVRNAAEAYDLAQARYQTGISSIVELSEAQLNLTSAQIANVDARYNVLTQRANLNYQTGVIH